MKTKPKLLIVFLIVSSLFGSVLNSLGQPSIAIPPADQSVSLGADVIFSVITRGPTQHNYQWRFDEIELLGATNHSLVLTNVQTSVAGGYSVVIADPSGSVTSRVATLDIDPTFTKITTGPFITDLGIATVCSWADYDNDGYEDLLFAVDGTVHLYRNNRDGTFTRSTSTVFSTFGGEIYSAAWGDYDNDGLLDLFLVFSGGGTLLYRNNGNGSFTQMGVAGSSVSPGSWGSWVDYDRDGFLDLFVAGAQNFLYHNNGDGTFSKIAPAQSQIIANIGAPFGSWADFNNDGLPDLFLAATGPTLGGGSSQNVLFQNNGGGKFQRVTNGPVASDSFFSWSGSWGDYDNDGFLDLFVANIQGGGNHLYRNNGDSTFTEVTNTSLTLDRVVSEEGIWGDYDNDGYLDLFVSNGLNGIAKNFLFHNNGDGTFNKILTGSLVNDVGYWGACAWADYDNDGFLDLVVPNHHPSGNNLLFHNNGNSNNWIKVKLVGTVSNRAALGAKVRVKATIRGKSLSQLREISCSDRGDVNGLIAHFGLGDCTMAETVRVEWPSGAVQEFHQVPAKQLLTLVEPPRLQVAGQNFQVKGGRYLQYPIESSSNLVDWTSLTTLTVTNMAGTAQFADPDSPGFPHRFYRAVSP